MFALFVLLVCCFAARPPKEPPDFLVANYTLDGTIPLEFYYVDDTASGEPTHYTFPRTSIDAYIAGASKLHGMLTLARGRLQAARSESGFDDFELLARMNRKENWMQLATLRYFTQLNSSAADASFSLSSFRAIVFGSMEPWLEVTLLTLTHLPYSLI